MPVGTTTGAAMVMPVMAAVRVALVMRMDTIRFMILPVCTACPVRVRLVMATTRPVLATVTTAFPLFAAVLPAIRLTCASLAGQSLCAGMLGFLHGGCAPFFLSQFIVSTFHVTMKL